MHRIYNSKIGRYKVYEEKNQKYLIDTQYTNPILELFIPPHARKLRAYQFLSNSISIFEKSGGNLSFGTLTGVLITQPLITFLYNIGESYFKKFSDQSYLLVKLILLIVTFLLTLSVYSFISKLDEKRFNKLIQNQNIIEFELEIAFPENITSNNIKHMKNYTRDMILTIVVILSIPLYLYLTTSDGSEAIMLVIISVLTFAILIMVRYAIQSSYEECYFTFKAKKEQ